MIQSKKNISTILTNDCHYTNEHDKMFHEIALCMQTKTTLSNEKRFSFGEIDVHVANHDWMWNRAQMCGIPHEALENTSHLANMINSEDYFADRKNRYPKYNNFKHTNKS